jgi:PKD repeat protein
MKKQVQRTSILYHSILLLLLFLGGTLRSSAQVMIALPPHNNIWTGFVRGYWFTAPTNFTIVGLRVPTAAGNGTQNIQVIKINDATPAAWPTLSTNFTSLAYINGAPSNVIQTVNIAVNTGDIIAVLGQASDAVSYSASSTPFTSAIGTFPITLNRIVHQGPITATPITDYSTEGPGFPIGRIEMYYGVCPAPTLPTATSITPTSASINWTQPTGTPATWQIKYGNVGFNPATAGSSVFTSTKPYTLSSLLPSTTYDYYVRAVCGAGDTSGWTPTAAFTTLCDLAALTGTQGAERCGPGTVTLLATGSTGNTIRWFAESTGGSQIGSGTSFATPSLTETDTFYVSASSGTGAGGYFQLGTDTGTNNNDVPTPFGNGTATGGKTQYLVRASELTALSMTAGNILSLGLDVFATNGTTNYNDFQISIGHTNVTTLLPNPNFQTGLSTVYTASSVTPFIGVNDYIFNTPFSWDGTSNIIIQICWSNTNNAPPATLVKTMSLISPQANVYSHAKYFNNLPASTICPMVSGGVGSVGTQHRPFFFFNTGCQSLRKPVIATIRPFPDMSISNDTVVCKGTPVTFTTTTPSPNTILWSNGTTTPSITVSDSGSYTAVVTSEYNCVSKDSAHLSYLPGAYVEGFNFTPLFYEDMGKVLFAPLNPVNVDRYEWDFGDGSPVVTDVNPMHVFTAGGDYNVTIRVFNNCGEFEKILPINVDIVTGIVSPGHKAAEVNLYPNPSMDMLTIENKSNHIKMEHITIFNALGATVYDRKADNDRKHSVSVSGLAAGIYSARILTDKGFVNRKFEVLK